MDTCLRLSEVIEIISRLIAPEARGGKMLPQSPTEIKQMITQGRASIVPFEDRPVAFAAFHEWQNYLEIGSLIADPDYRKRGFGLRAIAEVTMLAQSYPMAMGRKPIIALTNPDSARLFAKIGFRQQSKIEANPELWLDCRKCAEYSSWPECHCQLMELRGRVFGSKAGNNFGIIKLDRKNEQDLQSAAEFYAEVWQEKPWCEDFWEIATVRQNFLGILDRDGSEFLIAVAENEVVGLSIGYPLPQNEIAAKSEKLNYFLEKSERMYYIADLAVRSDFRQDGVGLLLTNQLIERLGHGQNCHFILRTHKDALAAQRLYEKAGFSNTKIPDSQYPDREYWLRQVKSANLPNPY